MLTYAHVCSRMLTYAHVCSRMLTYAGWEAKEAGSESVKLEELYADVC
jgi:hypothetical protein